MADVHAAPASAETPGVKEVHFPPCFLTHLLFTGRDPQNDGPRSIAILVDQETITHDRTARNAFMILANWARAHSVAFVRIMDLDILVRSVASEALIICFDMCIPLVLVKDRIGESMLQKSLIVQLGSQGWFDPNHYYARKCISVLNKANTLFFVHGHLGLPVEMSAHLALVAFLCMPNLEDLMELVTRSAVILKLIDEPKSEHDTSEPLWKTSPRAPVEGETLQQCKRRERKNRTSLAKAPVPAKKALASLPLADADALKRKALVTFLRIDRGESEEVLVEHMQSMYGFIDAFLSENLKAIDEADRIIAEAKEEEKKKKIQEAAEKLAAQSVPAAPPVSPALASEQVPSEKNQDVHEQRAQAIQDGLDALGALDISAEIQAGSD